MEIEGRGSAGNSKCGEGCWVFTEDVLSIGGRRNKVRTARPKNRKTKLMRAQVSESQD